MKTVAFVPIKLNSERLPMKNIRPFTGGEPLLCYILKTLTAVDNIDERYVYCSDENVQQYLPAGIEFLKRDPYYDLSTTSFNEVLISFAELVNADIYVLTHATAPFLQSASIRKGVAAVQSRQYDSAMAVERMQDFLWKDGRPINYMPDQIPRTQDLAPIYKETCGLYVYTHDLICCEHRRVGNTPYLLEVPKIEAMDINDALDFQIADAVYQMARKGE